MNVDRLKHLFDISGYERVKADFLISGFKDGFSLGYEGPRKIKRLAPNLKFTIGNETILWNKVMKEVREKRYAGPFEKPPFEYFIQSPIGLVPKDNGKDTRLIFHLSYPRGGDSVNSDTPEEICKVKYPDLNEAVKLILQEGKFCKMAKSDMKAAFRNLGISKRFWPYLLMKARSPIDKKFYYFVDKCLPFGSSISCAHFQAFSNGIAFLVQHFTGKKVVNYLDDYLFVALIKA